MSYNKVSKFLKRVKQIPYWDREPSILDEDLDELIRQSDRAHGAWLPVDEKEDAFDCSLCDVMVQKRHNFCPKCGAKMDLNAAMKKFEETVVIPACEYDRVNRLLAIPSLEDMTDGELLEAGANTHQNEGIFRVTFEDGSSLNFDLCSGASNYWDDVVWTSADGKRDTTLDCDFELGDIEFEEGGNLYTVHVVKEG